MQRTILVLILVIVGIGFYLFNQKSNSPGEVIEPKSPTVKAEAIAPSVKEAAKQHIEALTTDSKEQVLDITKADNFVTGEQLLKMPTMETETIAIEQVAGSTAEPATRIQPQAPQQQAAEQVSPSSETAPSADQMASAAQTATAQAVSSSSPAPTNSENPVAVAVVKALEPATQLVQGAASELQSQSIVVTQGTEPAIRFEVTEQNGAIELNSPGNSKSLRPGQRIRLQELLSDPDLAAGTVFYIHAVSPNDEQGLWGILQHGLIKTFAQGIELKESGRVLTAEIPMLADETLENRRSSFLGEFLYNKVQDTYVYNYQQGMLGQDPDLIKPGQQLIIVSYTEDELISIFNHFTRPGA